VALRASTSRTRCTSREQMLSRWERVAHYLDTPMAPLLVTAVFIAFYVYFRLAAAGFDPSVFVCAGDKLANPQMVPKGLHVMSDSWGYDGTQYYRLALDPFTSKRIDFGIKLDNPAYRQQRILYPLLAWALSLGRPELVPSALVLINWLALSILGGIAGAYARWLGRHALWGLPVPLYPGFILSLTRDLTEILEVTLLVAGLLLVARKKEWAGVACLSLAVLAKETALLAAVGLLLVEAARALSSREWRPKTWALYATPGIVLVAWQALLRARWGSWAVAGGGHNLGLPLVGVSTFLSRALSDAGPRLDISNVHVQLYHVWFVELGAVALVALLAATAFGRRPRFCIEKVAWVLYLGLVICLTVSVWVEDWAFMRALSEVYVLGILITLRSGRAQRSLATGSSLATWGFLAAFVLGTS